MNKKNILPLLLIFVMLFSSCAKKNTKLPINKPIAQQQQSTNQEVETVSKEVLEKQQELIASNTLTRIDMSKWLFNQEDKIYYQIGLNYCENPVAFEYQTCSIFVPSAFFDAVSNGDDTYTCHININGRLSRNTSVDCPIILPIETPGYSACKSLTSYSKEAKTYTDEGFVYVYSGARGREHGAPLGVVDYKACIRFLRYNSDILAGNTNKIITVGMSGGGAQSAIIGVSGNNNLFEPYLEKIGAVRGFRDDVYASMCWCPITNLDTGDMAYEWMMGSTRKNLTTEQQDISNKLAEQYGEYINELELKDADGNLLTLTKSSNGKYNSGSYYDYVVNVIEDSLNKFFIDNSFPYVVQSNGRTQIGGREGFGGPNSRDESPFRIDDEPFIPFSSGIIAFTQTDVDNIARNFVSGYSMMNGVYDTKETYINALNKDVEWVIYDEEQQKYKITSIDDFVNAVKQANKNIGAFDQLDKKQGENTLFGYSGTPSHFDNYLYDIVKGTQYENEFNEDFEKLDECGNDVVTRLNMLSPMYYLDKKSKGYKTSTVAPNFRIRTGCFQQDTSLTTEINLQLKLLELGVDSDFETVWGMGHVKAERVSTSEKNFISWVNYVSRK